MKVAFHPCYVHPVPENHRFPMEKYDLIYRQLIYEGVVDSADFFEPNFIKHEDLMRVHDADYLEALFQLKIGPREQRVTGFVHNAELIARESRIMEGTRMCAAFALEHKVAMNIAGGTHHAYSDRGEGFCLLNDQAIAAAWLIDATPINRVLIIDLDVHQGNGTAQICSDREDIFTFSMHGATNYPLKKEQSDCDVALPDNTSDIDYLNALEQNLDHVLNIFDPEFIFYQCGVDVLATDKLGRLGLSPGGVSLRDEFVFRTIKSLGVPVVCSMGGGYSPSIKDIVDAHVKTFKLASYILL